MKIIIRDEQGIKKCYAQLRDIEYLADRYGSMFFGSLLVKERRKGRKTGEDFVDITNLDVAKIIEMNPYIVDFSDMAKYDILTLSRMIILAQSPMSTGKQRMDEEHKVEDLQDLIMFNKGMLTYGIPVLYDENLLIDDGEVVFGSTTLPGYYMLRAHNKDLDLNKYLNDNLHSLFSLVSPEGEMKSHDVTKVDDSLLVHFVEKKKVLSNIIKRITR